ncbi:hypothetical protein LSCM1_02950 [Leishmania martiniquensis]|uniref:CRAL-TRIO domain-containing protein n=1 Tax=Leishmania martiniquensis TaxID=1580590 RepID=A0A836GPU4_9TRYP|nr:hypothetical protein LSCM1_02950 [Leishmania martiniquensis]
MSVEHQRLKKVRREAAVLAETKQALGFPVTAATSSSFSSSSAAAVAALKSPEEEAVARDVYERYGVSMAAVNAYLLRYLRSKQLSIQGAVAKLRRRRAFEQTLPAISVTPTTVAALRCGAFHLLGDDLEGRPVLYFNAAAFTLPALEVGEAQRLFVILLEFMQARCLLKNNADAAELMRRRQHHTDAAVATHSSPNGGCESNGGVAPAVPDAEKEVLGHLQQFTLLVNEEGVSWATHATFLQNCSAFLSMLPKYYPLMLGAVLVLEASFEIRAAIKACFGSTSEDVRDSVQMIERADLTRYVDARHIPVELGGHKQVVESAMNFSEAVLRHWFTLTSQMEEECVRCGGVCDSAVPTTVSAVGAGPAGEAGATNGQRDGAGGVNTPHSPPRPLCVPPPPLGTTQRRISHQRHTIELQHLSSGTGGGANAGPGSPAPRPPNKQGGSSLAAHRRHPGMSPAASASGAATIGTPRGTQTNQKDMTASMAGAGAERAEYATDDGVCSALSGADDRENDDAENDDAIAGMHTPTNSVVPTYLLHTAASSLAGSLTADGEVPLNVFSASHYHHHRHRLAASMYSAASATMSREETAYSSDHPDDVLAALRQERQRRQRAEQALQFRDLGVVLDMRNASTIERELASMHQDLNVLVAEILVKAEAARKRQKTPPTLNQLLDLTLTAFENATRTTSRVPAMALAEPVQREAVSSSCCSFM